MRKIERIEEVFVDNCFAHIEGVSPSIFRSPIHLSLSSLLAFASYFPPNIDLNDSEAFISFFSSYIRITYLFIIFQLHLQRCAVVAMMIRCRRRFPLSPF